MVKRVEGDRAEAVASLRAALAADDRRGAENPVFTARLLNTLGVVYQEASQLADSIATMERTIEVRERMFGPVAPDVAISHMNLALVLRQAERCEEALPHAKRAADIAAPYAATEKTLRWYTLTAIGVVEVCLGRGAQALVHLEEVVREAVAADHQIGSVAKLQSALALLLLHRPGEARELAVAALTRTELRVGKDHPDLMQALIGVARTQREDSAPEAARQTLSRALALSEKVTVLRSELAHAHYEMARTLERLDAPREEIDGHIALAETIAQDLELSRLAVQLVALRRSRDPSTARKPTLKGRQGRRGDGP